MRRPRSKKEYQFVFGVRGFKHERAFRFMVNDELALKRVDQYANKPFLLRQLPHLRMCLPTGN